VVILVHLLGNWFTVRGFDSLLLTIGTLDVIGIIVDRAGNFSWV